VVRSYRKITLGRGINRVGDMMITLLILLGIILIVELPLHVMKIRKTKVINFLTYLAMAFIAFGIGEFFEGEYSGFTRILSISFIGVAVVSLFNKGEEV
jgi:hypothetical protein